MKRAPLVITGTACGLVAVIGYHAAVPQASASTASASSGMTLNIGGSATTTAASRTTTAASRTATTVTTAAGAATKSTRSAVGSDVQYPYGDLELKVTMSSGRIIEISVVKESVTDPHSQQIDAYALPELRSQALTAQSAKLDGVSGASYTSAAYAQSLQSALDRLKA